MCAASWKNQQCGFQTGSTQTKLYKHRSWLEALNFGFRKKSNCTIRVAKTKALISFAVTAKLICAFVFAYADILLAFTLGGSNFVIAQLSMKLF